MHIQQHPLVSPSCGTQRHVTSVHFGAARAGGWPRKVYIQSSLHADEIPGMLVSHYLRELLTKAEAEQRLLGEIVLVPVANPIGLSQSLLQQPIGRFELGSGENFNRHYLSPGAELAERLAGKLGPDAAANKRLIRQELGELLAAATPTTELESLRLMLHRLAHDADLVIDLHCEWEGLMHIYAARGQWERVEELARYLECPVSLLADHYGDTPFDEAIFMPWQELRRRFPDHPIPYDSVAVTVELRGQQDVTSELAKKDAAAIYASLVRAGLVEDDVPPPAPLPYPTTPLEGSETMKAPSYGVLVLRLPLGSWVSEGELVAQIVDPVAGRTTDVHSPTEGLLYATVRKRYVMTGDSVAKVAGKAILKKGKLLDA
ncbi:M14 family metallopeptidase [Crenobacter sp. SG2305]|uniref:succinylglutamate desuccinylase/aspartoacylase family protein n=1 Tax=Crenobacter oryzisoli TaxID=3056844 RepID=UPI0025AA3D65|nr:succinylglutamate desuccinylase/aspartoacylase family protein [Crenobacter sp. SG2305]MDN0084072.1 M14 family metallopeptidase [Crenobacter sp. SG2305]